MLMLVAMLAIVLGPPILASQGVGRRGQYVAGAIATGAVAWLLFQTPMRLPNAATATAEERRNWERGVAVVPGLAGSLMAASLGCAIGAALFRSQQHAAQG
jgi:hypothetical protein